MSAKRAHRAFQEIDPNRVQKTVSESSKKKRRVNTPRQSEFNQPETFVPFAYIEHSSEPRLPLGEGIHTTGGPMLFFNLFWNDEICGRLVAATNSHATAKCNGIASRWKKPISIAEFRVFIALSVMMGVVRAPSVRKYWTLNLVPAGKGRCIMSCMRYYQIRRFLHISMPESDTNARIPHKDWWKKMEPLSSHLRSRSQELFLPGTHVSIDEMMIRCSGRSRHTVRIPSKPIPVGYKMFALCDSGYTINWLFASHAESIAELERDLSLSSTSSAVIQLCKCLDTIQYDYVLYTDNGFSNIPLFRKLRQLGIGACGTTRINSAEYPLQLKHDTSVSLTQWNTMDGLVVGDPIYGVLCVRWLDNNIVRILTTVHPWGETTLRERRKPRNTSTNAVIVRKAFGPGDRERKSFYIPTFIDDYNHHMNGVDLADQRRAQYTTHKPARRNWIPFFYAFLDISISNAYILFTMSRTQELNELLDSRQLSPEKINSHHLGRTYSAELFRRVLYKQLCQVNQPAQTYHGVERTKPGCGKKD